MTDFVVIDFETANPNSASICQIGVVESLNGENISEFSSLINPEDYFDDWNIAIHGINGVDVENAPRFPEIYDYLRGILENKIIVSHGWFDRHALKNVLNKYQLDYFDNVWIDSTRIVRKALPEYSYKGYGLQNIAKHFGIKTIAHDALDDAKTCSIIINSLIKSTGISIYDWIEIASKPIKIENKQIQDKEALVINQDGEYYGNSICFTGELSITRSDAQVLAVKYGFEIHNSVKKNTNFLVVGIQNSFLLHGHVKSTKQMKAEKLIAEGLNLKILSEDDFYEICKVK
jgi:DNA polymerase-3 subunit epsilon